jgi:hypothetical protein
MVELDQTSLKKWQDGNLEYMRYRYPLKQDSVIVDIGAYQGEWSKKIREMYGCENFTLFEPTDNIHACNFGHKIQACAWTEDTEVRTNGAFYYTSQLHNDEIGLNKYQAVNITKHFPQNVDLCKINVEGAEWYLIPYMIAKGLMDRCRFIQIQFHLTDKLDYKTIYKTITELLKKTHTQEWNCPYVWESWTRKC